MVREANFYLSNRKTQKSQVYFLSRRFYSFSQVYIYSTWAFINFPFEKYLVFWTQLTQGEGDTWGSMKL